MYHYCQNLAVSYLMYVASTSISYFVLLNAKLNAGSRAEDHDAKPVLRFQRRSID